MKLWNHFDVYHREIQVSYRWLTLGAILLTYTEDSLASQQLVLVNQAPAYEYQLHVFLFYRCHVPTNQSAAIWAASLTTANIVLILKKFMQKQHTILRPP